VTIANDKRFHRNCPCCGTSPAGVATMPMSHPDWPMKQCPNCDLIYLEWAPVYSQLYDQLAWTQQYDRQWERRLKEQPILARLDKLTLWRLGLFGDPTPAGGLRAWAEPGPVLDIGCSVGNEFAKLPEGYIPYGIEIERSAAAEARSIFEPRGGKVINADAVTGLAQLPADFFTGISMWGFLEHEAHPKEALQGARRVIKKNGVAVVKVPNFACWNRSIMGNKWTGYWHPDHVQYFTPKTMERLANDCGFSAKFRLYGRIPLNDYMYAILRPL
jgi:SAM-dependent methyltransferase